VTTGPTDARPIARVIADDIREKIEAGELAPGALLPTHESLAGEYQCSEQPARQALVLLRQEGLVVTRQGKGSFVRDRPVARRHGIGRYSRSRWRAGEAVLIAEAARQGRTADQVMRFLGEAPAPAPVAERLGLAPRTTVFARRRTTFIDGRPNQTADSYYPLSVTRRVPRLTEENTGPGGGFARIEEAGITLDRIREELSVRMPTGPESSTLKLPEGTPVVELTRTVTDTSGAPVEVMIAVIAGDMISFDYEFPVPD
jgi:GntR family transcriptional regulator